MGIEISDLRQKLKLLEAYGPFGPMKDIAVKLGKSPNTVWGWADGSARADANTVPDKNYPNLFNLFEEALRDQASPEQVRDLLLGPTAWLENKFRKSLSPSLIDLIDGEADMTRLVFYRKEKPRRDLVENDLEHETNDDAPHVQLDEYFRLVVERDLRGFDVLALQNANALWGLLPWQADHKTGHVLIPGVHPGGEFGFVRERNLSGLSLFLVMATKAPIPTTFKDVNKKRANFDIVMLDALADFYLRQSKSERKLFALWVRIGRE